MTDQLFGATSTLPAPAPINPSTRWVLHRAGIVNVWQYDSAELLFAGGRVLLRGSNGAGKSKALEVLLPFLLDGDTRAIDATGRDRTTVYWLMTDGRAEGNHVGYVWLELQMRDLGDDGEVSDRFLTIGAGLKAATVTRQSATWFFMTETARVGESLKLGAEVSVERLREQLGSEAVTQSATEHRRRVASKVFGLEDDARYRSLVHLLHRLRDPNIGNRVEAGELGSLLRDALPPVSETALDKAGERFETLDQIRDQLERIERTAAALTRFLADYASYARGRLVERAQAVVDAGAKLRRHRRELERLEAEAGRVHAQLTGAGEAVDRLRKAAQQAGSELDALKASEAYQQHRQLDDRRRAVRAKASEVATAMQAGSDMAAVAGRLDGALERVRVRVDNARQVVADTRAALDRQARAAGLDRGVLPDEAGAIPASSAVADGRRRAAEQARALAVTAARRADEAARVEEQAARSESDLTARQAGAETAAAEWQDVTASWSSAVGEWAGRPLPTTLTEAEDAEVVVDDTELRHLLDGVATSDGAGEEELRATAASAREMVAAVRGVARTLEGRARTALESIASMVSGLESEHAMLEGEEEARPAPSRYRDGERDPNEGAAFYELVEVSADLGQEEAAGLEAALEASGLLDAWVSAEGVLTDPATHDALWQAHAGQLPEGSRTLADVLTASDERVAPLLRTVALGDVPASDNDTGSPYVTFDGRWSLPPLSGSWEKPTTEYLGIAARRATRARRLADLERRIEEERRVLEVAEQHAKAAKAASEDVDRWLEELPPDGAVRTAAAEASAAERACAEAQARYDDDRRLAEQARVRARAARAELEHAAAADTLPTGIDELDMVISAATELAAALRHLRTEWADLDRLVVELAEAREHRDGQAAAAATAQRRAEDLQAELTREEVALRAIEEAVGASVAEVLRRVEEARSRQREAADEEPRAQERVLALARQHASLETRSEETGRLVEEASTSLSTADDRLQAAVRLPGVVTAALADADAITTLVDGYDAAGADGRSRLARQLLEQLSRLSGAGAPVSDGTILNRLHDLNEGLSGGYDVVDDEEDGVKFVMVADDSGRQPLPVVAERVSAEAASARERLAVGERETIERFLLGELAEEVRERLLEAHDLVRSANEALAAVRSSHGKGARLQWAVDEDMPDGARAAVKLLVTSPRSVDEDAQLRDALMDLISTERERDPAVSYAEHLRVALDYRRWHRFTVQVTDPSREGGARVLSPRLGLSQGEQRVLSYLALFAAASAHFDSIGRGCPRLLLLDDAFAKVDEPTHERLLRLLVDLDLDFVITSERMWGCFPRVPSLEIYEALRDPSTPGVALVHFHWDGHERHLVGI